MTANLPAAARALLATLQFRDGLGQSYLIPEPGGRVGVAAPTRLGRGRLARDAGYDRAAVQALTEAGLVRLAHHGTRPAYTHITTAPLPGTTCERIDLTAAGRAVDTGTRS